jgi:hypothetical protein
MEYRINFDSLRLINSKKIIYLTKSLIIAMSNAGNLKYKFFAIGLTTLLIVTIISTEFVGQVNASHRQITVGCKDLALALITWDQLVPLVPADDIAENEHVLNENGVEPDLYQDIIDNHLEDLLSDVKNKCHNLGNNIEDMLDEIDLELPS